MSLALLDRQLSDEFHCSFDAYLHTCISSTQPGFKPRPEQIDVLEELELQVKSLPLFYSSLKTKKIKTKQKPTQMPCCLFLSVAK